MPILTVLTVIVLLQAGERDHPASAVQVVVTPPRDSTPALPKTSSSPTAPVKTTTKPVTIGPVEVDSTVCDTNQKAKLVVVSISQQTAWMCEGPVQVYSSAVTTGDVVDGDATPTGSWLIQGKHTDTYLTGPGYRDFVRYWIPFDGDIGFHDASWQTMPFGSPGYTTQGSHGCVHLPITAVEWLYSWAQTGSTVVTVAT